MTTQSRDGKYHMLATFPVRDASREGRLPHIRVGRHFRYERMALERWAAEHRIENEAAAARSQVLVEAYSTKTADRFGANERIIDGHAYRFVLPAGTYQVTDSWLSEQLYLGPPITVRSGRVTHADLVSEICPP